MVMEKPTLLKRTLKLISSLEILRYFSLKDFIRCVSFKFAYECSYDNIKNIVTRKLVCKKMQCIYLYRDKHKYILLHMMNFRWAFYFFQTGSLCLISQVIADIQTLIPSASIYGLLQRQHDRGMQGTPLYYNSTA